MAELEILSPSQQVDAPIYLEACAGAGKTFTIEHLVARLLCHPDLTCRRRLDQIAVITFTRAAAADLRRRLQQCLGGLLEQLRSQEPLPCYLEGRCEEEKQDAQRCLELALHSFDRAWIGTIHGFCSRLLRRFGTSLGDLVRASQEQQLPAAVEQEWILEFLRYGIPHQEIGRGQWICLFRHFKSAPKLVEALRKHERRLQGLPRWEELSDQLLGALKTCPVRDQDEMHALWMATAAGFTGLTDRAGQFHPYWLERSRRFSLLVADPDLTSCDLLVQEGCPWLEPFCEKKRRKRMGDWSPCTRAQEIQKWAVQHVEPLLRQARHPGHLLAKVQELLDPHYQRWLSEAGASQPDLLIERVVACSQNPDWCRQVGEELHTLIVDEFQDTDPDQWSIFNALKPHLQLVLVGDPKQSIYAFREADLYTYLAASESFEPAQQWTLTRCYRSSRPVIDAINACMEVLEGMDLPRLGRRLAVARTLPRLDPPAPFDLPGLVWALFDQGPARGRWPSRKLLEDRILPALCAQIVDLKKRGVSWSQMAVVVRDRYQAAQVADALASIGIPSHTARGRSWAERRALPVLRDCIETICRPEEEAALLRLLASPLAAWGPEALQSWRQQPLLGRIRDDLLLMQSLLLREGIVAAVRVLTSCQWAVQPLCAKQQLEHNELVRDLLLLAEGLSCLEQQDRSLGMLWSWTIQEVIAGRIALPEEAAPAPPEAVQIMTIHMSKGLEFEAVFALGLCSRTPQESHHDLEEVDAEKLRQLYVALTRAKRFLWVPMVIDTSGQGPAVGECAPVELLLARLLARSAGRARGSLHEELSALGQGGRETVEHWIESVGPSVMGLQKALSPDPTQEFDDLPLSHPVGRDPMSWPRTLCWSSFTAEAQPGGTKHSLASPGSSEMRDGGGNPQPAQQPPSAFASGKVFGILWHAWMEKRLLRADPLPSNLIMAQWSSLAAGTVPTDEELRRAQAWIEACMDLPMWRGMRLNQVPLHLRRAEVPFLLSDRSQTLKGWRGSLDGVVEWEGDLIAIDWKTHDLGDHPENYAPAALWQAIQQGDYLLQARLYLAALKAAGWRASDTGQRLFIFAFVRGIEKGLPAFVTLTEEQLLGSH